MIEEEFAGYYRDAVGQDYAMARYYNSNTGSFFSQDPGSISTADSTAPTTWNRYGYANGDPVNFVDPGRLFAVAAPQPIDVTQLCLGMLGTNQQNFLWQSSNPDAAGYASAVQACQNAVATVVYSYTAAAGGADAPPSNAALLAAAQQRIAADQQNPDCAADFQSLSAALNELNNHVGFHDYGEATFTTNPKTGKQKVKGGQYGQYNPFTGNINLNSNSSIDWNDPTQDSAIVNGVQTPNNAIAGELQTLGLPANTPMSAAQFMDLVILHELAHFDGKVGNPDVGSNELKLWNDCVKQ